MIERLRSLLRRDLLAPVGLVAALVAGMLLDAGLQPGLAVLANPDRSRVTEVNATFADLPPDALVLVGMDADLGTYPEIRATARAAFADLLARGARLAFVSFTPEGRAIAAAEVARLARDGVEADRLLDLGFVAGAEAGLVLAVTRVMPSGLDGPIVNAIRIGGGGIAAFDMALVVGGMDFGPRSWVEQVSTRLPVLSIVAVAPTSLHPELAPYLRTEQLAGLLATVRDGAAYAQGAPPQTPDSAGAGPADWPLAMLIGMVVAVGVIGRSLASRAPGRLRRPLGTGRREDGA